MAGSIAEAIDNLEENADGTVEVPRTDESGDTGTGDKDSNGAVDGDVDSGDKGDDSKGSDGDAGGTDKDAGKSSDKDVDKADDDGGYIADELEEGGADKKQDELDQPQPDLSPELKYIVDHLPTLTVRGKQADGSVKTFSVKAAGQLPEDFEFSSKREEMMFVQALSAQESKAQSLQATYQREQQQAQATKYSVQENADIRSDIADLQREGSIPKFKYPPSDKRFTTDTGVKAAQEVMEFMNEKNQAYAKTGKLYRVSFKDAYEMMGKRTTDTKQDDKQASEDKERKKITRQMAGSGSTSARTLAKPRPAASMQDLINRLDSYDL